MSLELPRVTTRDGCRLDGFYQPANPSSDSPLPLDGCLLVHGTGGNFYGSTLLEFFADQLRAGGVNVLRVNTRGHDGISTTSTGQGGMRLGAAYEIVDDCRHDFAAWTEWLTGRVGPRIAWLGHSLGAVKAVYAAAHEPALTPKVLLAVSPPRLSYAWFCTQPIREQFLRDFHRAQELVTQERPTQLLEVKFPLAMVIAAGGFVEKYGPDERYNYLRVAASVSCPSRYLFGGAETANHAAFHQGPEELQALAKKHPRLAAAVVPEADHFYSNQRPQAWDTLEAWLKALVK